MRRRILVVCGLVLLLGGCDILGVSGGERRTIEVAANRGLCVGVGTRWCYLARDPGASEYLFMYTSIRGFEYEWGFDYTLEIEDHEIKNPPADGSSVRRELVRVISKEPVSPGTTFILDVLAGVAHHQSPGVYELFSGPEAFRCSDGIDCAGLEAEIALDGRVVLTLGFPAGSGEPFDVISWTSCETPFGTCDQGS